MPSTPEPAGGGQGMRAFGQLVQALREPGRIPAGGSTPVDKVDLLETHISCVLLAGDFAYKLKKPVDLGFLDFRSLEARRFCCEEEVRLNRRTAPSLYLDVVPVTSTPSGPMLGGAGAPIEYAVRMRRFAQDRLLDRMLLGTDPGNRAAAAGALAALGERIAAFHAALEPAGTDRACGTSAQVLAAALQNFDQIRSLARTTARDATLAWLRDWTVGEFGRLAPEFDARKRDGFVRECHGDLHLGNIVMLDGRATPFDCIEFNASFRWIDVMNEVAFLVMDLAEHGLGGLAVRFLNRYLESTGDYAGLGLLRFYVVYRAMVRAKVARIREVQAGAGEVGHARGTADHARYVAFARDMAASGRRALVLMHGLSGSGKSTIARSLAESLQAVLLRSDVERKRLHGLGAAARTASGTGAGLYSPAASERTYVRLATLARDALAAGFPVIVDAAFLSAAERARFRSLAREDGVPFAIVACDAPDAALRERVAKREAEGTDASEAGLAVLERQIAAREPLSPDESGCVLAMGGTATPGELSAELARRLGLPRG